MASTMPRNAMGRFVTSSSPSSRLRLVTDTPLSTLTVLYDGLKGIMPLRARIRALSACQGGRGIELILPVAQSEEQLELVVDRQFLHAFPQGGVVGVTDLVRDRFETGHRHDHGFRARTVQLVEHVHGDAGLCAGADTQNVRRLA